jgi:hypothetical protein
LYNYDYQKKEEGDEDNLRDVEDAEDDRLL